MHPMVNTWLSLYQLVRPNLEIARRTYPHAFQKETFQGDQQLSGYHW